LSNGILLQQLQDQLSLLVGLGEHGVGSLMENLILGKIHSFLSHVEIPYLGLRRLEIFSADIQTLYSVSEAVLVRAEIGPLLVH
jgi:hypothetical protein